MCMRTLNSTSSEVKRSRNTNQNKKPQIRRRVINKQGKKHRYIQHNYFIHLHLPYYKEPIIKI